MLETTRMRVRSFMKICAVVCASSATVITLGCAVAAADELGVDRRVSSRQADSVSGNSTYGDMRSAEPGAVSGYGEIRESMKAVPDRLRGTRARGWAGGWSNGMQGGLR